MELKYTGKLSKINELGQVITTDPLVQSLGKHQGSPCSQGALKTHRKTGEHEPCTGYKPGNSHNTQNCPEVKAVVEVGHVQRLPDVLMLGQNHPVSPCC